MEFKINQAVSSKVTFPLRGQAYLQVNGKITT